MQIRTLKIQGTGQYLPKQKITAQQLAEKLGLEQDWIEKKTGVLVRHFVEDETASEMGAYAATDALEAAGLSFADIDCLVCTSAVPEQAIPCTASLIHKHLGGENSGVPAFDINSTCLSFITGLDLVSYAIAADRYSNVLIVATEVGTGINWKDKESCTLFGDGAAAVVVSKSEAMDSSKIICSRMETYSKGVRLSECQGAGNRYHPSEFAQNPEYFLFKMNGKGIYRLASEIMPGFIKRLLAPNGLCMADMQMVIPHQASLMAVRLIGKQLGIPPERLMTIAQHCGNTVAASIPMGLHQAILQGRIHRGDRVMLLGTSAGFSVGAIVLEY